MCRCLTLSVMLGMAPMDASGREWLEKPDSVKLMGIAIRLSYTPRVESTLTVEDNPTNRSINEWTDPNVSSESADAVVAFLKIADQALLKAKLKVTTNTLSVTPEQTEVPHIFEVLRKRARASTPGNQDNWSLVAFLSKLMAVASEAIQLPVKGCIAKKMTIDVDTVANILILVTAA
ncbi:hypothetical protein DFH28DRAFT_922813 [Melampsora americana]|nr:hypothetical protein DFH28DRAFT_922813 [Melampsora americana]